MGLLSQFVHGAVLWKNPVDNSVTGVREVEIKGFAKTNSSEYPWTVANEFIASQLANRVGGLPVPVGAIVEGESGQPPAWVSLAFSSDKPPPADPATVVRDLARSAAGVVVFDVLIANSDRHRGNLRYAESRKQLYVFDHSHALLGIDDDAVAHMRAARTEFAVAKNNPNRHCLLDSLLSAQHVRAWGDEIKGALTIPFLHRVCDDLVSLDVGVNAELAERVFAFLSYRRDNLRELLFANRKEFTSIPDGDWGIT